MILRALGVVLAVTTLGCAKRTSSPVAGHAPVIVRIAAFKFAPDLILAGPRDSIVWVNSDAFVHTSTADNGTWGSPELAQGGRFAVMAPAPGRYAYHCAAHPSMTAVLEVRLKE